jgi:ribose transport system ATP-binding protein
VALYWKLGSGSAERREAVYGLARLDAGELASPARVRPGGPGGDRPRRRLRAADRKREAIFAVRPVGENVSVRRGGGSRRRFLVRRSPRPGVPALARRAQRSAPGTTRCSRSSRCRAGNQQKVVLGRWLERGTPVLVMIEPTRGVDVGARAELYPIDASACVAGASRYSSRPRLRGGRPGGRPGASCSARGARVGSLEGDEITTSRLLTAAGG